MDYDNSTESIKLENRMSDTNTDTNVHEPSDNSSNNINNKRKNTEMTPHEPSSTAKYDSNKKLCTQPLSSKLLAAAEYKKAGFDMPMCDVWLFLQELDEDVRTRDYFDACWNNALVTGSTFLSNLNAKYSKEWTTFKKVRLQQKKDLAEQVKKEKQRIKMEEELIVCNQEEQKTLEIQTQLKTKEQEFTASLERLLSEFGNRVLREGVLNQSTVKEFVPLILQTHSSTFTTDSVHFSSSLFKTDIKLPKFDV